MRQRDSITDATACSLIGDFTRQGLNILQQLKMSLPIVDLPCDKLGRPRPHPLHGRPTKELQPATFSKLACHDSRDRFLVIFKILPDNRTPDLNKLAAMVMHGGNTDIHRLDAHPEAV